MRTRLYVTDRRLDEQSPSQVNKFSTCNAVPHISSSNSNNSKTDITCSSGYFRFRDENMLPGNSVLGEENWNLADLSDELLPYRNDLGESPIGYSSCRKTYLPQ